MSEQPSIAEKDAGWLVPQTCVRCGQDTMHDSRVCGRCAEKDALAATLQGMDFSTYGVGNPWMHRAAQLLASDWMAQHDAAITAALNRQMAKATVLAYEQGRKDEREGTRVTSPAGKGQADA